MAGRDASPTLSRKFARRDPMRQVPIIRSTTFHWALAVAGVLAIFVIVLFGFIYWQTDQYLIARSDRMIVSELNAIAALPGERRLDAIDDHLKQDSRGVQYAGLFGADGRRIMGDLEQLPPELKLDDTAQSVSVVRLVPSGGEAHVIRAVARRMPNGDALLIGREVDETREISHVVAQALMLGLLPALCLCLLAGAWLSIRAQ
ncbi:MAG TPA: two-component sensor histidine kinase, partial [Bradyrhizobium sp.]